MVFRDMKSCCRPDCCRYFVLFVNGRMRRVNTLVSHQYSNSVSPKLAPKKVYNIFSHATFLASVYPIHFDDSLTGVCGFLVEVNDVSRMRGESKEEKHFRMFRVRSLKSLTTSSERAITTPTMICRHSTQHEPAHAIECNRKFDFDVFFSLFVCFYVISHSSSLLAEERCYISSVGCSRLNYTTSTL